MHWHGPSLEYVISYHLICSIESALWDKRVCVREDGGVEIHAIERTAYADTRRKVATLEAPAGGGDNAQKTGRVCHANAQALLDDGADVGQLFEGVGRRVEPRTRRATLYCSNNSSCDNSSFHSYIGSLPRERPRR